MQRLLGYSLRSPLHACMRRCFAQPARFVYKPRHSIATSAAASIIPEQPDVLPTGRPSKTASKRQAKAMLDLTRSMCDLSQRQLASVLPLLQPYIVQELMIARGIAKRNQARSRQENLVGRMLRELSESEQQALQAGVDAAVNGQSASPSPAEDLAVYWREQLLANNKDVVEEVFAAAGQSDAVDITDLRQLIRQCQQQARSSSNNSSVSSNSQPQESNSTAATSLSDTNAASPGEVQAQEMSSVDGTIADVGVQNVVKQPKLAAKAKASNKALLQMLRKLAQTQTP